MCVKNDLPGKEGRIERMVVGMIIMGILNFFCSINLFSRKGRIEGMVVVMIIMGIWNFFFVASIFIFSAALPPTSPTAAPWREVF